MFSKKLLLLSLSFSVALATAAVAVPIPEDAKIGGFAVGAQAYTFNRYTVFEAIEKASQAGAKVIEFYPGQRINKTDKAAFGHGATDAQIEAVKEQLKKFGVRAVNYGVVDIPKDEAKARKVFELAKKLELYAITTESVESIDTIEKLVKEYDIRVGFHNHPRRPKNANYKVWDANFILELVKDRDSRIGAAADVGHWATDGFDAVKNLRLLEGRIVSLHAKDRPVVGKQTKDVALGGGALGFPAILDELKRQNFQGNISIEHEDKWNHNVPEVAAGIEFVRNYGTGKAAAK
jgi:sugar phosphate isomerase/epimerase